MNTGQLDFIRRLSIEFVGEACSGRRYVKDAYGKCVLLVPTKGMGVNLVVFSAVVYC